MFGAGSPSVTSSSRGSVDEGSGKSDCEDPRLHLYEKGSMRCCSRGPVAMMLRVSVCERGSGYVCSAPSFK